MLVIVFAATATHAAEEEAPPPIELEEPIPAPEGVEPDGAPDGRDARPPRPSADGEERPPARIQAGGRVLAQARATLKKKGCAAAAPAYRVVAGMGEGFEAAQHELGDCLLSIETEDPVEKALFQEEGVFWLKRAAHAGNARAQRKLAILFASPAAGHHAPADALAWALSYESNPEADLYGFGPLPRTMVAGLKGDLDPADVVAAEAFAEGFEELTLAPYEPPADRRGGRDGAGERRGPPAGQQEGQRPTGGRRRR
ncbi:MAG: hypothetical protein AAF224_02690 [Pseudomonadota bacterium]